MTILNEKVKIADGWDVELRGVEFEALSELRVPARRERLSFKPTKNTSWYGAYIDDELVGCAGLIYIGGKARLKSDFILPEWRGLGLYHHLNRIRVREALESNVEKIVVITRHQQVFLSYGFTHTPGKSKSHMEIDPVVAKTWCASF